MENLNHLLARFFKFFLLISLSPSAVFAQDLPATFVHTLTNDEGESFTINFSRFSSRGPLFEVALQQSNGSFQTVDVGEPRTYIGTVVGQPGAVAACVRRSNGEIFTRMTFETAFEWIDYDGELTIQERDLTPSWPTFGIRDGGAGHDLYAQDLFIDIPNRYYGTVGGTPETCLEMVDFSMTAINLIYFRDVNLFNRIGRVSIRASLANDPYVVANNSQLGLLDIVEVESQPWVNGPDSTTDHDLATVVQSLIGGGVSRGIGTIGRGLTANGAFDRGDFATPARHELSHSWGVDHFDGRGPDEEVSPEGRTINSGNGLAKMSAPEMELALRERTSAASFLTNIGTTAPDMPPRAADDRLRIDEILLGQTIQVHPLINDNDSNGEVLTIVSADSTSLLGATVSLDENTLEVTFPSPYAYGYDYFRYQISDESGRTSTAVVHMQVDPASAEWEITPVSVDDSSLYMLASNKFEGEEPIEYFFEHVNGSQDSAWQTSRTFVASSLTPGQAHTYRVHARVRRSSSPSLPSEARSAIPQSVNGGLVFADDFGRTALNGSNGQSGEISPATYTTRIFASGSVGVSSNRLQFSGALRGGSTGTLAYIDNFNFGSPAMSVFDQVSIRADVAGYNPIGATPQQMALSIGQSSDEIDNQFGAVPSNAADLSVAYAGTTDTLEIYKNGTLINSETVTGNLPNPPFELELVYSNTSPLQGAEIAYEIYLDGRATPHTSGTFTWSHNYQNYISLASNLMGSSQFDNVEVEVATSPGFTPLAIPNSSTDYEIWAGSQPTFDIGALSDDFDSDGLSNDEERIWGLDPASNTSNNPYVELLSPEGTFQYTRRNPALSGLTYSISTSTDLQTWTEDLTAIQQSLSAEDAEVEIIQVTLSAQAGSDSLFTRIEAQEVE